jgi:glycosyltransferase involved in cell wall biosynthesis
MNVPIPILFTIPNFTTAGSGAAMLSVVERLDRKRFSPAVCVAKRGGSLEATIERMGIPYLEAPFTVPGRPHATLPFRAWRAADFFRSHRFAVWHSYHYLDDYTEPLIARFAGARAWVYTKKNMSWNRRWYVRTLLASRVAAQNTDMMRRFFGSSLFRNRSILRPPGVDVEMFRPDVPRRLALRSRMGIGNGTVVAGCVAHLVPVKGHPTLIEALAAAPEVVLWIAGRELDERYAADLHSRVHDLGLQDRVSFLGDVKDVPAFLAELDVFVLPTWDQWRMEGCPVALLEAMASGRACVASDIPGSRDAIELGRSGILVPPRDAAALTTALRDLAANAERRATLGRAARARILDRFSIEAEVRAYENLYEGLFTKAVERI